MDLNSVSALMKEEIGETMSFLVAGYPVDTISRQVNSLSKQFQSLGICYLLTEGDRYKYQENLARSAQTRIFLNLALNPDGHGNNRYLGLSRSEAILDALCAGQLKLALKIVDSAYSSWHRAWEYEDDHLYFKIIHRLTQWIAGQPLMNVASDMDRWADVLDGASSTRLELCKALIDTDVDAFQEAMENFIAERVALFEEKRLCVASDQADFWPRQFISTEALAMLNIAHWLNIAPEDEFEMCPPAALCAFQDRTFDNFFDEIQALV